VELQRYGFLFLLCASCLFLSCAKPAEQQNASNVQTPYDWKKGQGSEDDGYDDCSPANFKPPTGIVGGEDVARNNWLAKGIVFVMQTYKAEDGNDRTSICTASLIDTNMVLTAAHCVDKYVEGETELGVYFTPFPQCEKEKGRLQKRKRKVTEVRIHPLWSPDVTKTTDRGDLALLRISGRAPANYKPLKLTNEFVPVVEQTPVLVAGYGMVNPNYFGDFGGVISLRVTQAPGISQTEKETLLGLTQSQAALSDELHEFDNSAGNEMLYIDQSKGRGICGGDSGGPSIMKNSKGQDVVTGVASFVMNPEDPNLLCGYVAAHTSVFFHKDWIAQTFRELRNSDSALYNPFSQ
jgi:secreted trypsin-like serine protease